MELAAARGVHGARGVKNQHRRCPQQKANGRRYARRHVDWKVGLGRREQRQRLGSRGVKDRQLLEIRGRDVLGLALLRSHGDVWDYLRHIVKVHKLALLIG